MDNALAEKLERFNEIVRPLERVAVAFSAGVDSTFVLRAAADLLGRENVVAVTADSNSVARTELAEARELAAKMGVEHVTIATREMHDTRYLANPTNRCYFCKDDLYARLETVVAERGLRAILSGNNADDTGDWRPGLRAAAEHNVVSPAMQAGLTKDDIRQLSEEMGLPTWDKPATPCLSSRIAYGIGITPEVLSRVERAEQFLRSLGLRELRCRTHQGDLARIEVPAEDIPRVAGGPLRQRIHDHLTELGFKFVAIDLGGFQSGSLNRTLGENSNIEYRNPKQIRDSNI